VINDEQESYCQADRPARESNDNLCLAELERIVKGAAASKCNDEVDPCCRVTPAGIEHLVKDMP